MHISTSLPYPCLRYARTLVLIFILACGVVSLSGRTRYPSITSSYIDSVDFYLDRATDYTDHALSQIRTERAEFMQLPVNEKLEGLAHIGQHLELISVDSAIAVYDLAEKIAREHNNKRYINKFRYRKGRVMPMMGLVREGIEMYRSVTPDQIDVRDKFDYFTTGQHILDAAMDYYHVDSLKRQYSCLSKKYSDSILVYVKPGSPSERYYKALPKLAGEDRSAGIAELTEVLDSVDVGSPLFAKAAAEIAKAFSKDGREEEARYFFALSAIGDLRAGTRETTSLHRLGKILNKEEDYARAYDYLTYSLESAVASGSRLRTLEISEILPAIVKAGHNLELQRNFTLTTVVISLSVAIVIVGLILLYAFRTRHRLRIARKQLMDINKSKDLYIRKLLSLCGAYLTAIENFSALAGRKIKVGQTHDLLAMIESGRVIREQFQNFYAVFDDAFLIIYPDFVEQVNALLQPGKDLALTEEGHLSTELRILAFMRLGVDDSSQIAKFLSLSLNTIYTYRNKVKSRAIDRANFESNIRHIGMENVH